ncbi:glycoside hydrolase family 127 protein [Candidatus Poribacteria bacterium]
MNTMPTSPHAKLTGVGLSDVEWTQGFWAERFELCRDVMTSDLELALQNPDNGARLSNFRVAAGLEEGTHQGRDWSDGDCYKWLQSLTHLYAVTRDEKLNILMDQWIEVIGNAQDPDGYISTNIQLNPNKERWQNLHFHELYNMGHLMTAASVHHQVTGKDGFLKVARRLGDYLYSVFQPRPLAVAHFGFNPSNIMGSIDIYRATGDQKYLELAGIFVDMRGSAPARPEEAAKPRHYGGTDCIQDRMPLRRETQAVGHAVCATYLYSGATDLYAETGEKALLDALQRIWLNVTTRRMYLTGGVGVGAGRSSRGDSVHEAFGRDYELPSRTAYSETCSNIGNAMWNWRMLTLTGEAKYADVMETVLYNSMLSAVGIGGKGFFYCNPLRWDDGRDGLQRAHAALRKPVLRSFCCPPQVTRTIAGLHQWSYSISEVGIWVNIYGGNVLETKLGNDSSVKLTQETNYPWESNIKITIDEASETSFAVMLRIPGWASSASIKINGKAVGEPTQSGSYARLHREWSSGDVIELGLPLETRLMEAHPWVSDLRNKIAVVRGPVVYCAEFPVESGGKQIWDEGIYLAENANFTAQFNKDLLGGVVTLHGTALTSGGRDRFIQQIAHVPKSEYPTDWTDQLYRPLQKRELEQPEDGTIELTLVPYYSWANRGESYMEVWIPLAR